MKRIIIAVILLLTLTACTETGRVSVPKTDVPDATSAVNRGYELVFSSYRQGNTVLYYPQINGLDSLQRQDELNELIFEDAKKVIALFDDDFVCITVDYEILTKSDELISVKYTAHGCTTEDCDGEDTVEYISSISLEE